MPLVVRLVILGVAILAQWPGQVVMAWQGKTRNLVLITLDGVRTQEIFGGLDRAILESTVPKGQVEKTRSYQKYWAATAEERRQKLMPFFWGVWMKEFGSIAGNRALGSTIQVANGHRFSYPGYSEILTGEAHDDVINSNDNRQNPFPTVLEFLRERLGLASPQVAAFASWETLNWIAEHAPGSITINAGFEPYSNPASNIEELSRLQFETLTPWSTVRHDLYTFRFAMAHLETHRPRVLYISLGETDDWAHDGNYANVLEALHQSDLRLQHLWEFLKQHKQYDGQTTILLTVDHGRGNHVKDWRNHGKDVEGAQYIWLAVISPDVDTRGEWKASGTIYQNQIAATLCRFLGLDYTEGRPNAGKPIYQLFPDSRQIH
ncbi:MAG: alkaline phosphatase family protein [Acidobacteriota bacterium]